MEEWVKIIAPMLAPLAAIAALWWKITSSVATKEDVNRFADNLQKQINQSVELTLDLTRDRREDMRHMRSEIHGLAEKIDANSQAFHADISKLNDKIDANSQTLDGIIDTRSKRVCERKLESGYVVLTVECAIVVTGCDLEKISIDTTRRVFRIQINGGLRQCRRY